MGKEHPPATSKVPYERSFVELLRCPDVWPSEGDDPLDHDPILPACNVATRGPQLVWSSSGPFASRLAEVRRLREKWASDAVAAKEIAARLLNMVPRDWRAYVAAHREEMTTAVIDLILEAAEAIDLPIRMHELTSLATEVVAHLDDAQDHRVSIARTSARAWRHHASALEGLTRYDDALAACSMAEQCASKVAALCEDRAAIAYTRAIIHVRLKQFESALPQIRYAAGIYRDLGDQQRFVKTRTVEGGLLYESGQNDEALEVWTSLIADARELNEKDTLAFLHLNIGTELRGRGDFDRAVWHLRSALRMFVKLKMTAQVPRARLSLARIKLLQADYGRALPELWKVYQEFANLGMHLAAANRLVEIGETLLRLHRVEDAYEVCTQLLEMASETRLPAGAFDAVKFLRQCADLGDLQLTDLQHVGLFLSDLPQNPLSAFVRPSKRAGR
jgi:tetratricopeptide (TPR) repeat protein